MINDIVKFDDFINPNGDIEKFKKKNIDINDIYACSYVIYFILEHCNGEIMGNWFILDINYKDELLKYYYSCYIIYAINVLDKIVCEVV